MKKKIIAVIIAAVMCAGLLSACGSASSGNAAASASKSEAAAAQSSAASESTAAPAEETAAPAEETTAPVEETAAPAEETAAPETENATPALTVYDVNGTEITFDEQPQTFVVANYIFNFLLVGGKDSLNKVVGLTKDGWEDTRYGEYTALMEAYPELSDIPSIGGYHDDVLDRELILELDPDCLLISNSQYTENETSIPVWEQAGIRIVVLDYHKMILENDIASTTILGALLQKEDTAAELCDAYTNGIALVQERIAALSEEEKNIKVHMELGNQGPGVIGNSYDGMLWGAIIENVGAVNIAKGKLADGWGPLDMEYLLEANPDKIFIGGSIWSDDTENDQMRMGLTVDESLAQSRLKAFADRDWWQGLTAVQNGEIYGVDHGSLRNALDYTFTEFMAKAIYPELFEDIDPQAEYEAMLAKYLPEMTVPGTFMITYNGTGE